MNFNRIDRLIAECKDHLEKTGARNTEIESYLTGYVLTFISAEFELRTKALLKARAARSNDKELRSFVTHAAGQIMRGPKSNEITGMLRSFDRRCADEFHEVAGDQAKSAYDSIINNRHKFVHEAVCTLTLKEVEDFFNNSRGVFAGIVAGLGLRAKEIADLC